MEYYSAIKKEIVPFVTIWMDLEYVMLSGISQTKTNMAWSHLYVDSKKPNKQTKWNENRLTGTKNKQMFARREERLGEIGEEG